jgi:hypothetical protein
MKWRQAHKVSITVESGDHPSGGRWHIYYGNTPDLALFASNADLPPTGDWRRWQTIIASVGSSLAITPGEVALYDTAEGIAKAWSEDFANLGRDMNYVLCQHHGRSKK